MYVCGFWLRVPSLMTLSERIHTHLQDKNYTSTPCCNFQLLSPSSSWCFHHRHLHGNIKYPVALSSCFLQTGVEPNTVSCWCRASCTTCCAFWEFFFLLTAVVKSSRVVPGCSILTSSIKKAFDPYRWFSLDNLLFGFHSIFFVNSTGCSIWKSHLVSYFSNQHIYVFVHRHAHVSNSNVVN